MTSSWQLLQGKVIHIIHVVMAFVLIVYTYFIKQVKSIMQAIFTLGHTSMKLYTPFRTDLCQNNDINLPCLGQRIKTIPCPVALCIPHIRHVREYTPTVQ